MAAETGKVTSNARRHRIAAFTAVSVLFAVTSTVSALATQHDPAPHPAPVSSAAGLTAADSVALSASTARHIAGANEAGTVQPTVTKTASPTPTPTKPATKPVATRTATAKHTTSTKPAPQRVRTSPAAATRVVSAGIRVISHYSDSPGSQKAIDSCQLVLWTHSPLWLAGHNWCGWQWMAYVPTGSTVKVVGGAAAGTFVVTGHVRLSRQSGALPRVNADLVLQTCIGSGTGLTLLRRV